MSNPIPIRSVELTLSEKTPRYWYDGVRRSTGWMPHVDKDVALVPSLEAVLAEAQPLYERLLAYAIT